MSAPEWTAGQVVCGRYTIKAALRSGPRTCTYSALLGEPPREVVLRVVGKDDAAGLDAFAARVPELEALPAPYVLRVLEVATDDDSGARFVVTEHSRHPSLASLIGLGPLMIGEAVTLANELARIVDAAHDKRILHLGLKPTNVFVGTMLTGGVEVSDFAMPVIDDSFEQKRWLAPEQLEGATATAAADVFTTALLVFHAITGKHYWSATTIEALRAEMDAPLVAPWKRADELGVTLPPEMDEVFVKALSRAPADRPRRVADFARALDAAPKNVISVPPPPMELVASLAETENAARAGEGAAEAPIAPDLIVPVSGPAPAAAPPPPRPTQPAAPVDAQPEPHVPPPGASDAARRRRLVVVGVLGGCAAILLLGLVASAFRHCGTAPGPSTTATAAATTSAAKTADPVPTPTPAPQASEPPPVAEVDAAPPAPALGPDESELLVVCEPACNVVMVDRKSVPGPLDAIKLPPGKHGVGVSSPGCYGDWKLVTTKAGERTSVTFLLSKKPPKPATTKPPVPPKHR